MTFASVAGPEGEAIPDPEIVHFAPRRRARYTMKDYDLILLVPRAFRVVNWLMLGTHMSEGRTVEWDMKMAGDEIPAPISMDLGVILKCPSRSTWKVTIEVLPVFNDYAILVFYGILIPILAPLLIFVLSEELKGISTVDTLGILVILGWSLMSVAILILVSIPLFRIIDAFFGGLTKKVKTSFTFAADVQRAIPKGIDPKNLELLQGNLQKLMKELYRSNPSTHLELTEGTMTMTDWMLSKIDNEAVRARRRLYSQGSLPETFRVVFKITWELRECISSDIGEEDSLLDVVTLSGSPDHSVAIKCGEYLRATWGSRGMELFLLLHSQILSGFREDDHSKSSRYMSLDRF